MFVIFPCQPLFFPVQWYTLFLSTVPYFVCQLLFEWIHSRNQFLSVVPCFGGSRLNSYPFYCSLYLHFLKCFYLLFFLIFCYLSFFSLSWVLFLLLFFLSTLYICIRIVVFKKMCIHCIYKFQTSRHIAYIFSSSFCCLFYFDYLSVLSIHFCGIFSAHIHLCICSY